MSTLTEITGQFNLLVQNSKIFGILLLKILAGIWGLNYINWFTGSPLNVLGIIPRSKRGALGMLFSWIFHANFNHLFFNSIPLFILSLILISINKTMFLNISIIIILLEGFMVWILARKGNHLGASGLVAGYFGFLLIYSYKSGTILSLGLGAVILYYFGGILLSIFPSKETTSWEGHLFGLIAGIATFFINTSYRIHLI